MAVLAGASYLENFVSWCPGNPAHQQITPQFLIRSNLRPVEFRKKLSSRLTDLSRKSSRLLPLKLLPGAPRSSLNQDPASNPDEGTSSPEEKTISPESPSASKSQDGGPYVPGDNQSNAPNKTVKSNAAQNALERAAAYKKLKKLGPSKTPQSGQISSAPLARPATDSPQVEIIRGQNVQSRLQPSNSPAISPVDSSPSTSPASSSSPATNVASSNANQTRSEAQATNNIDVGKFIEERMAAARDLNSEEGAAPSASSGKGKQEPISLSAFERANAYKQQQTEMVAALRGETLDESSPSSSKQSDRGDSEQKVVEIEIITRDGVIKRKLMNAEEQIRAFSNSKDVKRKGVSGIDFAGLGFADKKKYGRPAGLSEGFAAPPPGALPEVEILTRDAGSPQTESGEQQGQEFPTLNPEQLYKPRVSTWGVFPRPADISKTYGGGRTIRPGESLETEEERKIREGRTQQLLDNYRKKMGLDVDPKIKAEADLVLKQGDSLMDSGRLREALVLYELAMNKMPAQSELHGLAALQAAICLDSLSRYDEARQVYEKLLAHPNAKVSKQARQLLFGFKAMEKLKMDGGNQWDASTYRKYFDRFADGYNTTYKADNMEETSENLIPYVVLLLFPIILVFALAASKGG